MPIGSDHDKPPHYEAAAARMMARLDELADFTANPGSLTRLYLDPHHRRAADEVCRWMQQAGMSAQIDAIGNVVGRYEGRVPGAPAFLLGSHIDTVRNAGRYDGCLGVVAAIEAVALLHQRGERLAFAIEVLAFGDEEGVRFPVTLSGSRAIAGVFDPRTLDVLDPDRVSLRQALEQFGADPEAIPALARRQADTLGYLELHIEQGPVLEVERLPVGIVSAINGASRYSFRLEGMAGHAGTVPMKLRADALAGAAEMALAAERLALDTPDLVATVGQLQVLPGAVNVIPGRVNFTLDIRSPDDDVRARAVAALLGQFEAIAERRFLKFSGELFYKAAAMACDAGLIARLERAVEHVGLTPFRLPSGAGHDGLAIAALCPVAMLFVRCKGGISHNPAESVTPADAGVALAVLMVFLRQFRG